jgi:ribonuclease Y
VEDPDRRRAEDTDGKPNDLDGRERVDVSSENELAAEGSANEAPAEDAGRSETGAEDEAPGKRQGRLEAKDQHIRELYEELTAVRLAADEAQARMEAGELRVGDLEEERERLKERLRSFEEEERKRRRQREGQDRRVARLEREIERREAEIQRLQDLLKEKEEETAAHDQDTHEMLSRKDAALEEALSRVEGLERDLEERDDKAAGLRSTIEELRAEIALEHEHQRRMAELTNRLRAGIELFNDSEHLQAVNSVSKSLGQPEVHVALGDGDEPLVILTFTWRDITWRIYAANPGLAVEEPRVYQMDAGEDLSGVEREPSNAHVGPDGRVLLGL